MTDMNRRVFTLTGLGALATTAACGNGVGSPGPNIIDARVDTTLSYMFNNYPGTRELADKSVGMLVMPLVTEAGFGLGGAYGRGALRINNATVDYYSSTKGSIGLQIGAQQYAHVLFFMTPEALQDFRRGSGWAAGANIEYAVADQGEKIRAETTTSLAPIVAVVFGQTGLRLGATLEGAKYTRIIP
jgi:lipid-binding SYLF domain-containing protein